MKRYIRLVLLLLLMGMLSSTLRWYGCNGSLQDLQKSLLYALSGYISGDGRVL